MYKLFNALNQQQFVIRLLDGAMIPFDPANMDFVEYEKWLSEGGVPLPADE